MENDTVRRIEAQGPGSILEEIARRGAPADAGRGDGAEVAEFLAQHAEKRDENGHRVVVRNGHMPARELISGIRDGSRSSSRGSMTASSPRRRSRGSPRSCRAT